MMKRDELYDLMQYASFDSMGGSYGRTYLDKYLDELDNRVCENCTHFSYDEDTVGHCEKGVNDGTDDTNYQVSTDDVVEPDFGCKKFKEIT